MGRYFGIANATKGHQVSHYWKADPNCDVVSVAHEFGWDKEDATWTASYCDFYIEGEEMEYDDWDRNVKPVVLALKEAEAKLPVDEKTGKPIYRYFGFSEVIEADHFPEWTEEGERKTCKKCGFVFDVGYLERPKKEFDGTFFMN